MTAQLTDYTTQRARAAEVHRRKLRRELLAQWRGVHTAIDAEKVSAVRRVSREQVDAARDEDTNAA